MSRKRLSLPWANAHRIADDHARDVSSLEAEGTRDAARLTKEKPGEDYRGDDADNDR